VSLSDLRERCALVVALWLAAMTHASRAQADERPLSPSVELLGGYGVELVKVGTSDPSAYGLGLGMRAGLVLPGHLYVGGTFVQQLGWKQTASDALGTSTYRGAYHVTYTGAELGWALANDRLLVRGYVGTGALLAFGRTAVGRVERRDDRAYFYVAPGLLTAARIGRWYGGFDMRFVMVPAQPTTEWAPALFFTVGTAL